REVFDLKRETFDPKSRDIPRVIPITAELTGELPTYNAISLFYSSISLNLIINPSIPQQIDMRIK
ncbi:MAG: hypothetical protein N0C81_14745, partial [Candidatus Thiodiazotropha lotti]|nr:hypothetical protein [Candidatus Thiodiazotropha lotti]MCW4196476.1 hypothetical protein [Candidatus Thiodiazotropha lotti]